LRRVVVAAVLAFYLLYLVPVAAAAPVSIVGYTSVAGYFSAYVKSTSSPIVAAWLVDKATGKTLCYTTYSYQPSIVYTCTDPGLVDEFYFYVRLADGSVFRWLFYPERYAPRIKVYQDVFDPSRVVVRVEPGAAYVSGYKVTVFSDTGEGLVKRAEKWFSGHAPGALRVHLSPGSTTLVILVRVYMPGGEHPYVFRVRVSSSPVTYKKLVFYMPVDKVRVIAEEPGGVNITIPVERYGRSRHIWYINVTEPLAPVDLVFIGDGRVRAVVPYNASVFSSLEEGKVILLCDEELMESHPLQCAPAFTDGKSVFRRQPSPLVDERTGYRYPYWSWEPGDWKQWYNPFTGTWEPLGFSLGGGRSRGAVAAIVLVAILAAAFLVLRGRKTREKARKRRERKETKPGEGRSFEKEIEELLSGIGG